MAAQRRPEAAGEESRERSHARGHIIVPAIIISIALLGAPPAIAELTSTGQAGSLPASQPGASDVDPAAAEALAVPG